MNLFRILFLLLLLAAVAPLVLLGLVHRAGGLDVTSAALAATTAAVLLALFISLVLARRVTKPLDELVHGALEIARGRFGLQVAHVGRTELSDLAYTFNFMSSQLAQYDQDNVRLYAALERGYLDTIRALASAIDAKDPYTRGHSERVARLAVETGRELELDDATLRVLEFGGILHDVGKIGIPEQVLGKPSSLTPEEFTLVRSHALIGAEIVHGVEFLKSAEPAIRHHHERWDGRGYPDGLAGEAIPLIARILNAADTWDACTSERPYHPAASAATGITILAEIRGRQTDPRVHDALLRALARLGLYQNGTTT
jgi:putative nucleotidyltransferase with HDIG domain